MRRPNFLFIITDQQRADYLGCYGHPVLKTPHIGSLAEQGGRFNRCYVNTPICMPNRAPLMTGRMPSSHGVRHNGIPLDPDSNTFTHLLGPIHYQSVIRVPLIWCDPDRHDRSGSSEALVSTMDIAASLLDRAGVEPFHGMQGESFMPALDKRGGSDALLIEEDGQRSLYGFEEPPRLRTLVIDHYRMTLYDGAGWGEL